MDPCDAVAFLLSKVLYDQPHHSCNRFLVDESRIVNLRAHILHKENTRGPLQFVREYVQVIEIR